MNFLCVALGGALGAVLRYTLGAIPLKMTFPLHTLIINIAGAILIGSVSYTHLTLPTTPYV